MTDRASGPPSVGLGWLRGTIRGEAATALDVLAAYFGSATDRAGRGTRWYGRVATLDDGRVAVAWDGIGQAAGTVMVDVTQTALDGLGFAGSLDLLRSLAGVGFRASRVDVYADDRARLADPSDVWAAIENGDTVTHARGGEWRENRAGGATAYLGERSSDRFLRVYRKDFAGDDPRVRWELESKGQAARDAVTALLNEGAQGRADTAAYRPWGPRPLVPEAPSRPRAPAAGPAGPALSVLGLILGFVDFRAREGSTRGDRAPRLAWWEALVGSLVRVRGEVARRVDSLARRVMWLRMQVAPTLAAIWARPEYGNDWLNALLGDGLDRTGGLAWARN